MARNRAAAMRRLSVEQDSFLRLGNVLTVAFRGETDEQALERLFGDRAAAIDAWQMHYVDLMTRVPAPGWRPWAWWALEKGREVPLQSDQPELLRQLGKLTAREVDQLEAWRRMVPEPPPDLSVTDQPTPLTILEDPDHVDRNPAGLHRSPTTEGPPPDSAGSPRQDPAVDPSGGESSRTAVPRRLPVSAPDLFVWPTQRPTAKPRETQGWETHS